MLVEYKRPEECILNLLRRSSQGEMSLALPLNLDFHLNIFETPSLSVALSHKMTTPGTTKMKQHNTILW